MASNIEWTSKRNDLATTGADRQSSIHNGAINKRALRDEQKLCAETAKTLANAGHAKEASLLYEKAESLSNNKLNFDHELSSLHASLGNHDQAIQRYNKVLKKNVDAATVNNYTWTLLEANRIEDAYRSVTEGLRRFPNDERLKSSLAVIEYRRGNLDHAFKTFEELVGASAAHHNLAVLAIDSGDIAEGKKHLDLAMQHSNGKNAATIQLSQQLNRQLSESANKLE